jgi:predicted phosphohydrolase
MMQKYQDKKCFYGHIHGIGHRFAAQGMIGGIEYRLAHPTIEFRPLKAAD